MFKKLLILISIFFILNSAQAGWKFNPYTSKLDYYTGTESGSDIEFPGSVTATSFIGDGSSLTGVQPYSTTLTSIAAVTPSQGYLNYNGAAYSYQAGLSATNFEITDTKIEIGNSVLSGLTTGVYNMGIGNLILSSLTTGNFNLAEGYNLLNANVDSSVNFAIGGNILNELVSPGSTNFGMGLNILDDLVNGSYNLGIGANVLTSVVTGSSNTAVGIGTLYSTTGSGNVALGYGAGYFETGSNKLFIDNTVRAGEADARTKALVYGIFDADPANQYFTVNGKVIATDVKIPSQSLGTPTYSTINDYVNSFGSCGRKTGGVISDATGGYVAVTGGTGFIKATDDDNAQLMFFDWVAPANIAIPANSTRYIGVEYNTGSPQVVARTSFNWNLDSEFPLGRVISDDINGAQELYIYNSPWWVTDGMTNTIEVIRSFGLVRRDEALGGLILSVTGTRNIAVTGGTLWSGLNEFEFTGINTAVSGTFEYYWYKSGVGWQMTDSTQFSVTQWNDITQNALQTIDANKYCNIWVYGEMGSTSPQVAVIYPQAQYNTAAAAEAKSAPDNLPAHIRDVGKLLGRIIIKQGVSTPIAVQTVFTNTFTSSVVTDHGNLSGLGDDDHTQYWISSIARSGDFSTTGDLSVDNISLTGNAVVGGNLYSTPIGGKNYIAGKLAVNTTNTATGNSLYVLGSTAIEGTLSASGTTVTTLDTGQGANELYDMNQNVQTTDAVTFSTVDTGQGANELYDMNQNVQTTDDVIHNSLSVSTNAGVKLSGDGDGAITFLGLGDGFDEDFSFNLDDTADTIVVSSTTGVTKFDFGSLILEGKHNSSDATAGASATTGGLTFKDGLYTSGTIAAAGDMSYSEARFKVVNFERDTSTSSGTQAITGLGFRPKAIIVSAIVPGLDLETLFFYDGSATIGPHRRTTAVYYNGPIIWESSGNYNSVSGTSLDADGFTITWTKNGSPSNTAQLNCIAFR